MTRVAARVVCLRADHFRTGMSLLVEQKSSGVAMRLKCRTHRVESLKVDITRTNNEPIRKLHWFTAFIRF